ELRRNCKELSNICFKSYLERTELSIQERPKSFWRHINKQRKTNNFPNIMTYNSLSCNNLQSIVNSFADFFSSVYLNDNVTDLPSLEYKGNLPISDYQISVIDIIEGITELRCKYSYGPDGIPSCLLKNCVFTLVNPLKLLFNLSLNSGKFPTFWKNSFLKPIYKSGAKEEIDNYRAVSNQSEIPKLLDRLRVDSIKDLGLTLNTKLNFQIHINNITTKALKLLGFVNRTTKEFTLNTYKLLYCSLVRSQLEYCSVIWNPYYNNQKEQIENVQNKFLRGCAYKMGYVWGSYNYNSVRFQLNLNSLANRRIVSDVCFLSKIITNKINSPSFVIQNKFQYLM
ncbi:hypothetical protein NQ318_004577, partial [Aromia moschata]